MNVPGGPFYGAVVWLIYTLFGLAATVGVGALASVAVSDFSLGDITDGGQFAVYTASMLVGTYYVVHKPQVLQFPRSELFGIVLAAGLMMAAAFVTLSTLEAGGVTIDEKPINPNILRWPTVGLFFLAAVVAFRAVWVEGQQSNPAPAESLEQQLGELTTKFRRKHAGGDDDGD